MGVLGVGVVLGLARRWWSNHRDGAGAAAVAVMAKPGRSVRWAKPSLPSGACSVAFQGALLAAGAAKAPARVQLRRAARGSRPANLVVSDADDLAFELPEVLKLGLVLPFATALLVLIAAVDN